MLGVDWPRRALALACAVTAAAVTLLSVPASALPSFADQTGHPCSSCHVGGFGPQLTEMGREFKLGGYTMRSNSKSIPFSVMMVGSSTRTAKNQDEAPTANSRSNNNTTLDEASLFFAGGLGKHLGAFIQSTYSGIDHHSAWDNLDARAVTSEFQLGAANLRLGLDLNNNPTIQDPWNTLPAWGFPFTQSDLAPSAAAAPLLAGGLGQNVLGGSAYAWINSKIYAEFGLYRSNAAGFQTAMGVAPAGVSLIHDSAPYARLAYQANDGNRTFHIGAVALLAGLYPSGDKSTGATDHYTDLGIDTSYQRFIGADILSFSARAIRETQHLSASQALGDATNASNSLSEFAASGSYYWRNRVGGTLGLFRTTGTADALLYADNASLKPDTAGYTAQIDVTPFATGGRSFSPFVNLRLGLQYTGYSRFDGGGSNYNGTGRSASDNNTTRVFSWLAF